MRLQSEKNKSKQSQGARSKVLKRFQSFCASDILGLCERRDWKQFRKQNILNCRVWHYNSQERDRVLISLCVCERQRFSYSALENIKFILKYNFRVSNHFFQKEEHFRFVFSRVCVELKKNSQENNIKGKSSNERYTRNEQKNNIEIITFSLHTIRNNFKKNNCRVSGLELGWFCVREIEEKKGGKRIRGIKRKLKHKKL